MPDWGSKLTDAVQHIPAHQSVRSRRFRPLLTFSIWIDVAARQSESGPLVAAGANRLSNDGNANKSAFNMLGILIALDASDEFSHNLQLPPSAFRNLLRFVKPVSDNRKAI